MAKTDIWMPVYIGDYLSDTMHLSTEQHGAYILLLLYGWRNNGLIPSDDDSLSQICRMPLELWKNNRAVISRFFQTGLYWTQKRQLEEIEKAASRRESAKSNGIKGGRPKNNPPVISGLTLGLPGGEPEPNPRKSSLQLSSSSEDKSKEEEKIKKGPAKPFHPPTVLEISEYCLERKNKIDPERFWAFYESNGWKVGRNPMKSWKAAITTWEKGSQNGTNKHEQFKSKSDREWDKFQSYYPNSGTTGNNQGTGNQFLSIGSPGTAQHRDVGK